MKKALLLVCVLSISVITTACINNFAVQELNNKAAAYMEKGNYAEAIERLKSSVDLDDSMYETHYNLAIAYTKNDDYLNAIESYRKVISLNPDFADAYYSLAVAQEGLITDIRTGELLVDDSGNVYKAEDDADDIEEGEVQKKFDDLSEVAMAYVEKTIEDAILNYQTYLDKGKEVSDKAEVEARINDLNTQLKPNLQAAN